MTREKRSSRGASSPATAGGGDQGEAETSAHKAEVAGVIAEANAVAAEAAATESVADLEPDDRNGSA